VCRDAPKLLNIRKWSMAARKEWFE
jgi:hypothetical protein